MELQYLNTQWLRKQGRHDIDVVEAANVTETDPTADNPSKRVRGSGGGPWRHFCHRSGSSDMALVAEMYRARTPAEQAYDKEEGQKASARRRAGHEGNAFGEKPSRLERNVKRRNTLMLVDRIARENDYCLVARDRRSELQTTTEVLPCDAIKQARALDNKMHSNEIEARKHEESRLQEFPATNTKNDADMLTTFFSRNESSGPTGSGSTTLSWGYRCRGYS